MSRNKAISLNPNFWVLLRIPATSSAKLRNWSMAEGISSHQFVSSFHTCTISKPMSYFLCKSFIFGSCNLINLPPISGKNQYLFPLRWISSSENQQSFGVSYLVKSFGFSPQSALSASKYVNFKTPEKADKLINLFKKYGFTQVQISRLIRGNPGVLVLNAEKNILPKLEFLKSIGISGPEMAKKVPVFPTFLNSSLTQQIIPTYDFFRNLFRSDEKVISAVKRSPHILTYNIEKNVIPKFDILREHGVPDSKIALWMLNWPMSFKMSSDRFRKILEKVEDMGFDASSVSYVVAAVAFRTVDDLKWESKVDAYKKWGWSEEEVLKAFHTFPWCMMLSEDKLMAGMDFFINQMGLRPSLIARRPKLLSWSLKKRLIPRYSVFQVLLSKSLVQKINLNALFESPEKKFLQKFVAPYKAEVPELLKLYEEKLDISSAPLVDKV